MRGRGRRRRTCGTTRRPGCGHTQNWCHRPTCAVSGMCCLGSMRASPGGRWQRGPRLRHLDVARGGVGAVDLVEKAFFGGILQWPALRWLSLAGCRDVARTLPLLADVCPRLQHLDVSCSDVRAENFGEL